MSRTRYLHPLADYDRGAREPTQQRRREAIGAPNVPALFRLHTDTIRSAWQRHQTLGVVVHAFSARAAIGSLWLDAALDAPRLAILGRHPLCDLVVPSRCTEVSLRHLAIGVRALDLETVRIRVMDLATGSGFVDESGRALSAVTCDDGFAIAIGSVSLLFLPTPHLGPIPSSAEDMERALPPRVFLDEHSRVPSRPRAPSTFASTIIRADAPPVLAERELCPDHERPLGWIHLDELGESGRPQPIAASALARGVLIGRYERCHLRGTDSQRSAELSRVHAMLWSPDGVGVWVVDTASSNGVVVGLRRRRLAPLQDGERIQLTSELGATWTAAPRNS
jgi:hypothetical protein